MEIKNNSYFYTLIEDSILEHLKNTPNLPISFKIGNSEYFNFTSSSLKDLNNLLNKYKNDLYDSDRYIVNIEDNPNITLTAKNHLNNPPKNNIYLNSLLSSSALNILSSFHQLGTNAVIIYKPFTSYKFDKNTEKSISDFDLVPVTKNILSEIEFSNILNKGFNILSPFPLESSLSDDFKYFSIMESFKNKPILNPSFKYNWNPNYDVFKSLPKKFKYFESNVNKCHSDTEDSNIKILSSSLTRSNSQKQRSL